MARGSILERENKNGTVTFSIKYRTGDGTQVKKAVGRSRREAERALTNALAAVDRGELKTVSRECFEDVATRWLERKKPRLEDSTYSNYDVALRLRLIPAFGTLRLKDITRGRIESYMAELDAAGELSRKTINDSLIPLRQILARAVRDGAIPNNPADSRGGDESLKLPHETPPMLYLNREDARLYLDHTGGWYRPMAEVLIGAGLRLGEAIAVEWKDIDWTTPAIRVERSFKVGGKVGTPKGDRGRTVVIAPYLAEVLREHRAALVARRQEINPLLFPSRTGGMMWPTNVWRRGHKPVLVSSGLNPNLRVHDLRHTAATLWLAAGESIYFVQQQLGHRDIRTTIGRYGHPDRDAHVEAAARAAEWWGRESGTPSGTTARLDTGKPLQNR